MSVHQVLFNADIFRLICNEVYDNTWPGLGSAAVLARTCRAFSDIALDVLWYTQDGLANLVRTMPADLWEELIDYGVMGMPKSLVFKRAVLPADWCRFKLYAARIHKLDGFLSAPDCTLSDDVLIAISIHARSLSRFLLPNLRALRQTDHGTHAYDPLVLGPRLRDVDLKAAGSDVIKTLPTTLACIGEVCVGLQSLCLRIDTSHTIGSNVLLIPPGIIQSLQQLRTFEFWLAGNSFPRHTLLELASLPRLESLTLSNCNIGPAVSLSEQQALPPLSYGYFPALLRICINQHLFPSEFSTGVFAQLANLETVNLDLTGSGLESPPPSSSLSQVTRALYDCCDPNVLRKIEVKMDGLTISQDDFCWIYHFHSLEVLHIFGRHCFALDDSDLRDMARAWPKLQVLATPNPKGAVGTLRGAVHFAQHCPSLTALYLPLDTRQIKLDSMATSAPAGGIVSDSVMSIGLYCHPDSDLGAIAAFISVVFPRVTSIGGFGSSNCGKMVEKLLPVMAVVRRWSTQPSGTDI